MASLMIGKEQIRNLDELRTVCDDRSKEHEYLRKLFTAYREERLDLFLRNSDAVEEADKIKALNSETPDFPARFRDALGLLNPPEEVENAWRTVSEGSTPSLPSSSPPPDEPGPPAEKSESDKPPNPDTSSHEPAQVHPDHIREYVGPVSTATSNALVIKQITDNENTEFRDFSVRIGADTFQVIADMKKNKVSLLVNGKLIAKKSCHKGFLGKKEDNSKPRISVKQPGPSGVILEIDVYVRKKQWVKLCVNGKRVAGDIFVV